MGQEMGNGDSVTVRKLRMMPNDEVAFCSFPVGEAQAMSHYDVQTV